MLQNFILILYTKTSKFSPLFSIPCQLLAGIHLQPIIWSKQFQHATDTGTSRYRVTIKTCFWGALWTMCLMVCCSCRN